MVSLLRSLYTLYIYKVYNSVNDYFFQFIQSVLNGFFEYKPNRRVNGTDDMLSFGFFAQFFM